MTTQMPRNQPNVPRPVQGPSSMPRICPTVHHQAPPARMRRTTTRPKRARLAANAGRRPPPADEAADRISVMPSGGPREVRLRQSGLPLVLDAERADPRSLRLGHGQIGARRVEHPGELHRFAGLHAERHDVLDLEVDGVPDADAMAQPVVVDLDRRALDAQHLADQWSKARHRPTQLSAEHLHELIELRVRRALVDEHPDPPVAVGHHLRRICYQRDLAPCDVRAVDRSVRDVEDERHATEVVGGPVVQRQVARAHELAGAGFHVATRQVPGHGYSLCRAQVSRGAERASTGSGRYVRLKMTRPLGMVFIWYFGLWA